VGLDVKSRKSLSSLLSKLAATASPRILLALREQDHVPSFVTHILQINGSNKILHCGLKEYRSKELLKSIPISTAIPADNVLSEIKSRNIEPSASSILADLKNVNISYWGKPVLSNVNWTIREGDHWLLLGPNGSGKTTLLSLLTGDNPKSYSQDITLFGRKRGTGETIFDIQAKIGHVSPELHYHFPAHRIARDAILSGFGGTFAPPEKLSHEHQKQYNELIEFFGEVLPKKFLEMRFRELSTSHQRLVLLMRAFVKRPPLLILDEPYQGMDEEMINRAREYLETEVDLKQAVIMVTHFVGEEATGGRWGRVMKLMEGGAVEEIV
jgi:molybdate transport system ATP-binding protein